ncbi:holo-ACP synthase [Rhodoferax sp.]|jgi:holo-[acyl-carrier protein] synthase|uniref:holo-ACP synthase n=1 Tax=Rhodoferax sp. TaxID=50421 RepID=UPI0025FC86B7|nr:holo-ACP synthase [Rhodoferax sp.]MCM2296781.1 holo-ACP synthase [Rhodoferax sp.]
MKFNSKKLDDRERIGRMTSTGISLVPRRHIKHKLRGRSQTDNTQKSMSRHGNLIGHGLDVVDVAEFSRLLRLPACAFLDRYFTESELFAAGEGVTRTERLAGRFAIKEAVLKALCIGWGDGVSFTDVEVITHTTGAPSVVLHRKLEDLQRERHIAGWLVSSSHTDVVAVGSAIAFGM